MNARLTVRRAIVVGCVVGALWFIGERFRTDIPTVDNATATLTASKDIAKEKVERWDTYPPESVERQRVVGRLLITLCPGMTRNEVEAIIGPPANPRDGAWSGTDEEPCMVLNYYCQPPHLPPLPSGSAYLLQVVYDAKGPVPRFTGRIARDLHHRVMYEYEPWGHGIRITDDPRTPVILPTPNTN